MPPPFRQTPIKAQIRKRRSFLRREDGAVTVDFVVLTAAAIALVTGFFAAFSPAINSFLQGILARLVS
jgi:hypothetical protein